MDQFCFEQSLNFTFCSAASLCGVAILPGKSIVQKRRSSGSLQHTTTLNQFAASLHPQNPQCIRLKMFYFP